MTNEQKLLAFHLLSGEYYLVRVTNKNGTEVFKLYKGNQVPVKYYRRGTINKFKHLLKKDRKNRLTINLNLVRQLHGKNHIKKTYKTLQTKIQSTC